MICTNLRRWFILVEKLMRCYQRGQESFVLVSMLQTKIVLVEVFVFKLLSWMYSEPYHQCMNNNIIIIDFLVILTDSSVVSSLSKNYFQMLCLSHQQSNRLKKWSKYERPKIIKWSVPFFYTILIITMLLPFDFNFFLSLGGMGSK